MKQTSATNGSVVQPQEMMTTNWQGIPEDINNKINIITMNRQHWTDYNC